MKTSFKSRWGNNVQKTILKSVAVLTSLVLISFSVNAQGSWKQLLANNSFGAIAKVLVESSSKITTKASESNLFIESNDPSLELEAWMTENVLFTPNFSEFEDAYEAPLEIEEWMVDKTSFTDVNISEEKPLQLENWMFADNFLKK